MENTNQQTTTTTTKEMPPQQEPTEPTRTETEDDWDNWHKWPVSKLRQEVRRRGLARGRDLYLATRQDLVCILKGEISELPHKQEPTDSDSAESAKKRHGGNGSIAALIDTTALGVFVKEKVKECIEEIGPTARTIEIRHGNGIEDIKKIEGSVHKSFEKVIRLVSAGLNVLMVGPAGSGKTSLARSVAEALDMRFSFNSMSAGVTEASILGRIAPNEKNEWIYRPSPFVTTYRDGGIHLFDELDAADSNLMVIINAALANGHLSIPVADLVVERSTKCVILCAANTFGTGPDRQYVGRNQLDAATLDRFAMSTVVIDYDRELERGIANGIIGDPDRAADLLSWAWNVREKIEQHRLRRIMSTRSIWAAARRMLKGETLQEIRSDYFEGWTTDEKAKVGE